jgi:formylglycine-generating enzyme required for sulfatase activity
MSDKPKDDDWGMTMPHMRLEKDKNADDFADDFAPNPYSANQSSADEWGVTQQNFNLPPNQASSDFDKTTPNINIPKDAWRDENPYSPPQSSGDDWGMTTPNINIPGGQKQDDWGATAPNINIPQENKPSDWGMTVPNVNVPKQEKKDDWSMPAPVFRISEGEKIDNLPKRTPNLNQNEAGGFDKTAPNFNLSEVSSSQSFDKTAPNRNLQSQPNVSEQFSAGQAAVQTPQVERASSGGGSKMIYVLGGIIALLFFGIVALAGAYFLFLNKPPTAQKIETPREEPKEIVPSAAPIVISETKTDLPKEINYKGAMVLVAAGEFTMGSDTDTEESKPAHKVTLPAYYIDKTEVTNAEYKKFCDETGKSYPPNPHLEKDYFTKRPNAPVVGVSFADAQAYAAWAGKRLPTEAEWEKAASWDETSQSKRVFPWGNDFQNNNAAFGINSISDVGKFSAGASSCGALDMAGNVLEWVDAFFQPYPDSTSTNAEFGEKNRVVRGGHFSSKSNDSLKTTKRIYVSPDIASGEDDEKLVAAIIGFRCAVSADAPAVKEVLQAQSK